MSGGAHLVASITPGTIKHHTALIEWKVSIFQAKPARNTLARAVASVG
jgi:hypothetical protein